MGPGAVGSGAVGPGAVEAAGPAGTCLVNSAWPGQVSTISPPSSRASATTGVRSRPAAPASAAAAESYSASVRRVAMVGGIISSSPRS